MTMCAAIHSDVENPRECSKDPADSNGFFIVLKWLRKKDKGNKKEQSINLLTFLLFNEEWYVGVN
jgi:hypothetical protein